MLSSLKTTINRFYLPDQYLPVAFDHAADELLFYSGKELYF